MDMTCSTANLIPKASFTRYQESTPGENDGAMVMRGDFPVEKAGD
jgi:hypothetical protein